MELKKIICLVPVFNDWESFSMLIKDIEKESLLNNGYKYNVIAINDGSTDASQNLPSNNIIDFEIVDLKLNVGHQRAIAIGIQYILDKKLNINETKQDSDGYLVIMDGDGEDKPSDILPLVKKVDNKIVFAKRIKRSEGTRFKIGYYFYKLIFKTLTGKTINYGNFSAIPFHLLEQIAVLPNIWNHYAGSIAESKIKKDYHPTERGTRYAGKSKMNLSSLIIHGFSSISIYFDTLCFRVLKFSFLAILFCAVGIGIVLFKKLFTDSAIPGWASSLILIVLSIVIQLFSVTFIILLLQLRARKEIAPPNLELYKRFISRTSTC